MSLEVEFLFKKYIPHEFSIHGFESFHDPSEYKVQVDYHLTAQFIFDQTEWRLSNHTTFTKFLKEKIAIAVNDIYDKMESDLKVRGKGTTHE